MNTEPDDMKLLDNALKLISEHFDTVQIFATRHEPEVHTGTVNSYKGVGNWYARYGQIKEWVAKVEKEV